MSSKKRVDTIGRVVQSTGQSGESIMLGGDESGNLGSRVWHETLNSLVEMQESEGLSDEQITRLAKVASGTAISAIAAVFDRNEIVRFDLHRARHDGEPEPTQTFVAQKMSHRQAIRTIEGESNE